MVRDLSPNYWVKRLEFDLKLSEDAKGEMCVLGLTSRVRRSSYLLSGVNTKLATKVICTLSMSECFPDTLVAIINATVRY